jgi:hypothetical protein
MKGTENLGGSSDQLHEIRFGDSAFLFEEVLDVLPVDFLVFEYEMGGERFGRWQRKPLYLASPLGILE